MNTVTISLTEYMELKNLEQAILDSKEIINISFSPYGPNYVRKYSGTSKDEFIEQCKELISNQNKDLCAQKKEITSLITRIKRLKKRNLIERIFNL